MTRSIAFLALVVGSVAFAQRPLPTPAPSPALEHLHAFWRTMAGSTSYRARVQVTMADARTGKVRSTTEAKAYRKGDLFLGEMGGMVNLAGRDHYVMVDPEEKYIMVRGKGAHDDPKEIDPLEQWNAMLQKMGEQAAAWSVKEENDAQVVLRYDQQGGPYRNVVLTLRKRDHLPVSMVYDLVPPEGEEVEFDQVRIQYLELQVGCALSNDLFDAHRFVKFMPNGEVRPSDAYRDHHVKYIPAS